jgi:hypothetical protein
VEEKCTIPPPISLNCWKHHTGFIKKQIKSSSRKSDLEKLKKFMLKIGESQMDLYYGECSPNEISEQIIKQLEKKNHLSAESYNYWLYQNETDYQTLTISDKSVWILRLGDDKGRYVHIHPGRYSPYTRRVKAITLKTAILTLCYEKISGTKTDTKETVNYLREKYLNQHPLKEISGDCGIGRLLSLLQS